MRLLRLAALALAGLLLAPFAHAQLIPSFGVTGGVNFGSLNDVAGADLENSTGFHVGVYGDVGIGPLALRPALLYLRSGEVQAGASTVTADFVTLPIDVKFQTPTPVVKAYALVGPEFRFPVGEGNALVDTKSTNVAVNVGAGVSFNPPLVGPSGFAEVRYALDVSGFAEALDPAISDDYKLSLFMIRVGFGL